MWKSAEVSNALYLMKTDNKVECDDDDADDVMVVVLSDSLIF